MQERQKFEDNWRKAFDGAEMTPSETAWNNIELELAGDESKRMKKRVVFYQRLAAAMVFMTLAFGIYTFYDHSSTDDQLADKETVVPGDANKEIDPSENKQDVSTSALSNTEIESSASDKTISNKETVARNEIARGGKESSNNTTGKGDSESVSGQLAIADTQSSDETDVHPIGKQDEQNTIVAPDQSLAQVSNDKNEKTDKVGEKIAAVESPLLVKKEEDYKEPQKEEKREKKKSREAFWLAMGASAGSYNPTSGLSTDGSMFADVSQLNGPTSASSLTRSRSAGSAYSAGVSVGKKISNRWVLQSGVNYVNQQIQYSSNTVLTETSNQAKAYINEYALADASTRSVTTTTPYDINSAMELVSVPLQAGYLIIDRKLGWQINGGVSTDFFMRNTLVDESGRADKFSQGAGGDSPYRTVNWSGLMNTELSYKIGTSYRLSLVPGIRYTFTSVLKSEVGTSNPLILDVGFRFRYIFN